MKIALTSSVDATSLAQELQTKFPQYKVKNVLLNKKSIRITNGMDQVIVGQHREEMICVGNLNMLDLRIFIPFVLGIALFFITGFIFMMVMIQIRKKSFKAMEEEIGAYLVEKYNL